MYLFLYIYLVVFYFFLSRCFNETSARKIYIYVTTGILAFGTAYRNLAVGNDTYAYYNSFINSPDKTFDSLFTVLKTIFMTTTNQNKDPGYVLIEKFFYKICFGSFELYQLIIGLLLLIPIGYILYKFISDFSTYIISYIFYISLFYHFLPNSATRQTIALIFYFCSFIIWIKTEKKFFPILLLFLGSFVHKSLLICILPFLVINIKNQRLIIFVTLFFSLYLMINGTSIAFWMGELVKSEAYVDYAKSQYYENMEKPFGFIIQMYSYFLLSILGRFSLNGMDKGYRWFYINFCFAIVLCPLILVNPSLLRLSSYFSIWGIFFLPTIIQNCSFNSKLRLIIYWIILFLTLGRPVLNMNDSYRFKWQYMELHERYN